MLNGNTQHFEIKSLQTDLKALKNQLNWKSEQVTNLTNLLETWKDLCSVHEWQVSILRDLLKPKYNIITVTERELRDALQKAFSV